MFRKITTTQNVGDNTKLGTALGQVTIDTIAREYEAIATFMEKRELLDAAFDVNRATHDKDEEAVNDARASMIRLFQDLESMSTAYCDINLNTSEANKDAYKGHLKTIKAQVHSVNPDYEKLTSAYYQLKAYLCGIANFKKIDSMTNSINTTNDLRSEQVVQTKCTLM